MGTKLHKKFDHPIVKGAVSYGLREEIPLRINACTLRAIDPTPVDPLHFHKESTQFFLVVRGHLRVEVEREIYDVTPDAILEITPGSTYRAVEHEGDTAYVVIGTVNKEGDRVQI